MADPLFMHVAHTINNWEDQLTQLFFLHKSNTIIIYRAELYSILLYLIFGTSFELSAQLTAIDVRENSKHARFFAFRAAFFARFLNDFRFLCPMFWRAHQCWVIRHLSSIQLHCVQCQLYSGVVVLRWFPVVFQCCCSAVATVLLQCCYAAAAVLLLQ